MLIVGWLGLELTDSAWWVSMLGFYRSIPLLLIGPWGALVTDRFPRRRLLSVFQGLGATAALLVLLAFLNGSLTYVQLALFSFIQGGIWALDWPTRRAIIPDLVGRERVVDALVLENGIQNITRILGPISGGVALELLGVGGRISPAFGNGFWQPCAASGHHFAFTGSLCYRRLPNDCRYDAPGVEICAR